jgi:DNA-directed RNA polymerase subunit RPC12/RpoP
MLKSVRKIYGPYKRREDNRAIVQIHYLDGTKTTQLYAKYLLEQNLGRHLTIDETVDHKDENPLNDSIDNLQILSLSNNIKKSKPIEYMEFICPNCNKEFEIRAIQYKNSQIYHKNAGPYCSKRCAGKIHH